MIGQHQLTMKLAIRAISILSRLGMPTSVGWIAIQMLIRDRFPQIEHISTQELVSMLDESCDRSPLLIDCRTAAEYAVSHLDRALHIEIDRSSDFTAMSHLDGISLDRPIVVYCAVGYRSAIMAERLQALGYTQVFNLQGSIFKWANEGRPVYRDRHSVKQVHPYNRLWGCLLQPQLHVYSCAEASTLPK
jgi:rhodanese-related sulfurtransferase